MWYNSFHLYQLSRFMRNKVSDLLGKTEEAMDDAVRDVARTAAKTMETSGHAGLRLQVEEAIAAQDAGQLVVDIIALSALTISTAGFAWRVAWDLYVEYRKRKQEDKVDTELRATVEKAVREELESATIADQATRALMVKATTDAVIARLKASH
jgi:hypothetical protein